MVQINTGTFEEIKELDEEQYYSSGFNSGRSGDKQNPEQKNSFNKTQNLKEKIDVEDQNIKQIQIDDQEMILTSDIEEDNLGDKTNDIFEESYDQENHHHEDENVEDEDVDVDDDEDQDEDEDEDISFVDQKDLKYIENNSSNRTSHNKNFEESEEQGVSENFENEEMSQSIDVVKQNEEISSNKEKLCLDEEIEEDIISHRKSGNEANPNTPLINKRNN